VELENKVLCLLVGVLLLLLPLAMALPVPESEKLLNKANEIYWGFNNDMTVEDVFSVYCIAFILVFFTIPLVKKYLKWIFPEDLNKLFGEK